MSNIPNALSYNMPALSEISKNIVFLVCLTIFSSLVIYFLSFELYLKQDDKTHKTSQFESESFSEVLNKTLYPISFKYFLHKKMGKRKSYSTFDL